MACSLCISKGLNNKQTTFIFIGFCKIKYAKSFTRWFKGACKMALPLGCVCGHRLGLCASYAKLKPVVPQVYLLGSLWSVRCLGWFSGISSTLQNDLRLFKQPYFTSRCDELISHFIMNPVVTSHMDPHMMDNKISPPVGMVHLVGRQGDLLHRWVIILPWIRKWLVSTMK